MSEDLSDLINNVKNMVDSGNIPDNVKEMLGNLNSNNNATSTGQSGGSSSPRHQNVASNSAQRNQISSGTDTSSNSSNSNGFNIDIDTMLKMKSIVDAMNQKDDPRSNLLYSLKPYLRDSRKSKLDQYVNLLNMTKIADIMRNDNKENNGHV